MLPLFQVKKYLIIRFSSIGDIVLTTPVIRCVKEQTGAEVHYITKRAYENMLVSNPYVDKVHSFDKDFTEILPQLKAEEFDFVIDLHNNLRSVRLKKNLRKPSAAFPKLNKEKFLLTNFKWNIMPDVHVVDRYFEAVKKLGVTSDGKGLDYFIPEMAKVNFSDYRISDNYIVFSIGAKFATKRLPNSKITAIIQKIDKTVVLLGGPEDVKNAEEITAKCANTVNLVGKLNLDQSAFVIQQTQTVITHDTGLMHIAAAFQKHIVSIWGNTVPELGMYPYMPENANKFTLHEVELKCRPCSKIGYDQCPKKHFRCMVDQDVEEIVEAIL